MRMMTTLSATGALGHEPIHPASFHEGVKRRLDFIGADAGSGDSGPYFLGADRPMNPREWEEHDLGLLFGAARQAKIPLVIGSAGGAGTNRGVDDYTAIIRELARKQGLGGFRLARIYSEVPLDYLRQRAQREVLEPLGAPGPLTPATLERTTRVVAMMGVEPYLAAFERGADVIVAGRSCDDAIFAALPLRAGFPKGLAFHLGKTLECASLVATPSMAKETIVGTITEEYVELEPMHPAQRCTPGSVAGHSLYERVHPYSQAYPGGVLDTSTTVYEQIDERRTRFRGSCFIDDPVYKLKLEGAERLGSRAYTIGAIRDPIAIRGLDHVLEAARAAVRESFPRLHADADYRLLFHVYGRDGVMGPREPVREIRGHEVCIVTEVVADDREVAGLVARFVLYRLLFPTFHGQKATAGGLAMIADEVLHTEHDAYRWSVDHLLPVDDPLSLFPMVVEDVP